MATARCRSWFGLFSIAIPFVYLGLMICVLGGIRFGVDAQLGKLFRWTAALRPWVMIEVYLVGCCVAYTRLESVGTVNVDAGGWCLLAATLATVLASLKLDEQSVWTRCRPITRRARRISRSAARPAN